MTDCQIAAAAKLRLPFSTFSQPRVSENDWFWISERKLIITCMLVNDSRWKWCQGKCGSTI